MHATCKLLMPLTMTVTGTNSTWVSYMLVMACSFTPKGSFTLRCQLAALSMPSKMEIKNSRIHLRAQCGILFRS